MGWWTLVGVVGLASLLAFVILWGATYGGANERAQRAQLKEAELMDGWFVEVERWDAGELSVRGATPYPAEERAVQGAQRVVDFYKGLGGTEVRPGVVALAGVEHRVSVKSGRLTKD